MNFVSAQRIDFMCIFFGFRSSGMLYIHRCRRTDETISSSYARLTEWKFLVNPFSAFNRRINASNKIDRIHIN